jgi:RimJ/RimL family protein N-acetyltransferase
MPGATFLEGESVTLATIEEADLAFVHEWVNHPSVRRSIGQWYPTTRAQERRWWEADAEDGDSIRLLVTVDGERAGAVELEDVDRTAGRAELAVWLHPDYRGNGRAREAVELLVGYAFDELRLHRVVADAYADNDRSRRILDAVGFVHEGTGREDDFLGGEYVDTVYYGLLVDEWRERGDARGAEPG